jgi:superfamily II DNA/RNA helicase
MIDILAHGRRRALMPRSLDPGADARTGRPGGREFREVRQESRSEDGALLIGGVQMGDQVKALQEGVDVLIATPGRLMDLFERGKILLTGCSLLVIDEADRMLDMGFIPDIENICTKLPPQRQTLLFSATMPRRSRSWRTGSSRTPNIERSRAPPRTTPASRSTR